MIKKQDQVIWLKADVSLRRNEGSHGSKGPQNLTREYFFLLLFENILHLLKIMKHFKIIQQECSFFPFKIYFWPEHNLLFIASTKIEM